MLPDSKIRTDAKRKAQACLSVVPRQGVSEDELASAFAVFNDAAGSLERSYGLLRSEVKRLRNELEGKSRELELERAKHLRLEALAEISNVLAHEVRNPLGSLELFSTLAADAEELTPETRELLQQMQAGIRMLAATVNNVFHSHHLPVAELRAIDVSEVIRGFAGFVRPIAARQNVEIEENGPAQELMVFGDPNRLHQVLLNLGLNSLRAMPQGGTISIHSEKRAEWIEISVSDTGTGIARELFDRIFEQGFSACGDGSGLGLAVCKQIIEQHGGSIAVESESGCGTTMRLRLRAL